MGTPRAGGPLSPKSTFEKSAEFSIPRRALGKLDLTEREEAVIADQAPPKTRLPEWMKGRPVLLGISAMILVAALIGVGVLIGQLTGPKTPWVLWMHAYVSGGGTTSDRWSIVHAYESKKECEREREGLDKGEQETQAAIAKGVFDPRTGSYTKSPPDPSAITVSNLFFCLPQRVDPRSR